MVLVARMSIPRRANADVDAGTRRIQKYLGMTLFTASNSPMEGNRRQNIVDSPGSI